MEKINQLIEIVYDNKKRKLRARCIQDGRWVRFPNKLRIKNKIFKAGKMKKGRGDSWIASQISEFNPSDPELLEVLQIKNKAIKKLFYEHLEYKEKINTEMLNIIFIVKSIKENIDENLIKPLIKYYNHEAFISEDYLLDVKNMLMSYNERRIVSLFANYKADDFIEDCAIMYQRLFERNLLIDDAFPKKPKSIRELHEVLTRESKKITQNNFTLCQDIEYLNNQKINDTYTIFVPTKSYDLIDIGNSLSICVGNGYYASQVFNKQSSIIALKKNNKFVYCIELKGRNLHQCRGEFNTRMPQELEEPLKEILFSKKAA